jgi:hypothetical protein
VSQQKSPARESFAQRGAGFTEILFRMGWTD